MNSYQAIKPIGGPICSALVHLLEYKSLNTVFWRALEIRYSESRDIEQDFRIYKYAYRLIGVRMFISIH